MSNTVKFTANNVVSTYGKTAKFSVKLKDKNGKLLKNKLVTFKVAGKNYEVYSNSNGVAAIKVKLDAGKYKVSYICDDFTGKNTITFKNNAVRLRKFILS